MKFFKLKVFLAIMLLGLFILSACSDNTTTPVSGEKPLAPSGLQATSIDSGSIKIKWQASTSESNALWAGYVLTYVGDDGSNSVQTTLTAGKNPYLITGLTEGVIYTITIKAKLTNGETSDLIVVKWSPASRFDTDGFGDPIQVYEFASIYGSGLQLFNASEGGPQVRKTNSKDNWDLGLDTRSGTIFGSATQITFGTGSPAITEISDAIPATGLNEIFDSKALDQKTFSEKTIDLANQSTGFVIVARSKQASSSWNYAKIFVEKGLNGFLQGSGSDRYIKCYISYQKKAGVPYAKIK